MRQYKILGAPERSLQVLAQLELHGVTVERIVVMQPFEQLSRDAQEALLAVERSRQSRWIGWSKVLAGVEVNRARESAGRHYRKRAAAASPAWTVSSCIAPRISFVKRVIDLAAAICLVLVLGPVLALVALLVAIDVGFPLVFWQQRPGRHGHPFKLFKFRTMRPAHDARGQSYPRRVALFEASAAFCGEAGSMSFPSFTTFWWGRCPSSALGRFSQSINLKGRHWRGCSCGLG